MADVVHYLVLVRVHNVLKFVLVNVQVHLEHLSECRCHADNNQCVVHLLLKALLIDVDQRIFDV